MVVDTIIYDASTGAVVNRLSGGGPYPVLSDDGRTVFAARPHDRLSAATLWRADVDSGTTSSVLLPGLAADPRAFVDPRTGHLFVVDYEHFAVYDPDSLQLLRVRERYAVSPHWGLAFDRDRPWAYALDIAGVNTIRTTFSIIDTDTLATLGAGDLPLRLVPRQHRGGLAATTTGVARGDGRRQYRVACLGARRPIGGDPGVCPGGGFRPRAT